MKTKQKKGNKYESLARASKAGEQGSSSKKQNVSCPTCNCHEGTKLVNSEKTNLCHCCHDGLQGHVKMAKPKYEKN